MNYQYVVEVTLNSNADLDPVWVLNHVVGHPGAEELEPTATVESIQVNKYKSVSPEELSGKPPTQEDIDRAFEYGKLKGRRDDSLPEPRRPDPGITEALGDK